MIVVHKYRLPMIPDTISVSIPLNAEVLAVREQGTFIAIWARVNTDNSMELKTYHVVETGKEAPMGKYLGTACFGGGLYVLHVFESEGSQE